MIGGWGFPDERPSWSWPGAEGVPLQVNVYSQYDQVQLYLNGRQVQAAPQNVSVSTRLTATYSVSYTASVLTAVAFKGGVPVANRIPTTPDLPAPIRLIADRSVICASRNDLTFVRAQVADAVGNLVPYARVPVSFIVKQLGAVPH